jgi:transposase
LRRPAPCRFRARFDAGGIGKRGRRPWAQWPCSFCWRRCCRALSSDEKSPPTRRSVAFPQTRDPAQQQAFIANHENLLNNRGDDEAVLFADAVHPTHEARPAGCWAPKDAKVALEQTSGRQRLNIHGAIDLETGATRMIEATTIDALSTIALLMAISLMYPTKRLIHVFVDNARYHHALLVQEWLARPGCRIRVHYIPSYCPHLDSIERLWGLMHRHVTHNRCYATYNDFCRAVLHFLREEVPKNWATSRPCVA